MTFIYHQNLDGLGELLVVQKLFPRISTQQSLWVAVDNAELPSLDFIQLDCFLLTLLILIRKKQLTCSSIG